MHNKIVIQLYIFRSNNQKTPVFSFINCWLVSIFVYIEVMLINLWSPDITFITSDGCSLIPFSNVEKIFSQKLINYYKQHTSENIYVIVGPGSFTNLRVGILSLQWLQYIAPKSAFFSTDKLSFFYALYKRSILPRYGIVYFWQRKNLWLVDCLSQSWTLLPCYDILLWLQTQDTEWSQQNNYFIDYIIGDDFIDFEEYGHDMISFNNFHDSFVFSFHKKEYDITEYFSIQQLQAFYGIDISII